MATKKIKKQVKKIQNDAEKELKKMQNVAKSKFKAISKKANKEVTKARNELDELEIRVKKYIKDNPEKLFVAAAGIGAFVGAMTATLIKHKGKRKK